MNTSKSPSIEIRNLLRTSVLGYLVNLEEANEALKRVPEAALQYLEETCKKDEKEHGPVWSCMGSRWDIPCSIAALGVPEDEVLERMVFLCLESWITLGVHPVVEVEADRSGKRLYTVRLVFPFWRLLAKKVMGNF